MADTAAPLFAEEGPGRFGGAQEYGGDKAYEGVDEPFGAGAYSGAYEKQEADEALAKKARQSSVFWFKMLAGLVRFLFEDCIQGFCQCCFLAKNWHHVSYQTRAFTMASVGTGLLTSLAGPLREYVSFRSLNAELQQAKQAGADYEKFQEEEQRLIQEEVSKVAAQEARDAREASNDAMSVMQASSAYEAPSRLEKQIGALTDNLEESLRSGRNSVDKFYDSIYLKIHLALIGSGLLFWGSMAAIPYYFDEELTCKGVIPLQAHMLFGSITVFCVLVEIWAVQHSKSGISIVRGRGTAGKKLLALSVFFSILGRFDTYSDTTFVSILHDCPDITFITIKEFRLDFPEGMELYHISFACLVFGVYVFQALLGMFLLICKKSLPMALKFSEFNLVLAVMELDHSAQQLKEAEDDVGEFVGEAQFGRA